MKRYLHKYGKGMLMENGKKNEDRDKRDQDIVFSKTIKAGKRIYYIDVKKNRKEDYFLAITESKRVKKEDSDRFPFEFEKHKIFLYKEDFEKFTVGLNEALAYIRKIVPDQESEELFLTDNLDEDFTLEEEISFKIEGLD